MMSPKKSLGEALGALALDRHDEAAWGAIYETLRPFVYAIAYRELRGAREAADEATQETFYRLIKYVRFEDHGDATRFRAYVARVALNTARSVRAHTRRPAVRHASIDELEGDDLWEESAEEELELRDSLVDALKTISRTDRNILLQRLRGHSYLEIARGLGVTEGNVAVRLHRLRTRLKAHEQLGKLL